MVFISFTPFPRPLRVATIRHNERPNVRVRLTLERRAGGLSWFALNEEAHHSTYAEVDGPLYDSIESAEHAAVQRWGSAQFDLRAKWLRRYHNNRRSTPAEEAE